MLGRYGVVRADVVPVLDHRRSDGHRRDGHGPGGRRSAGGVNRHPIVRWMNADTGEIKERSRSGVDRDTLANGEVYEYEWEQTPLELALALVPDIEAAIKATGPNEDVDVRIQRSARP